MENNQQVENSDLSSKINNIQELHVHFTEVEQRPIAQMVRKVFQEYQTQSPQDLIYKDQQLMEHNDKGNTNPN